MSAAFDCCALSAPTPPGLDVNQRYSVADYFDALCQAAASVDPVPANDTTGG